MDIYVGNVGNQDIELPYFLINDGEGTFLANWEMLPDEMFTPGGSHLRFNNELFGGIFWNDGTGHFSSEGYFPITPTQGIPITTNPDGSPQCCPASWHKPLPLDIDNDGDLDLIIGWSPANFWISDRPDFFGPGSLQVWVNKGNREFVDETLPRVGQPPQAAMGINSDPQETDFNGDGCKDIFFYLDLDRNVRSGIWLNDCKGNFTPVAEGTLPKRGSYYIPFDYDNDGDTDLISAIPHFIRHSEKLGCSNAEEDGNDFIDFSILLNITPRERIFVDSFETKSDE